MGRWTAMTVALAAVVFLGGMTGGTALADPCARMRAEIAKLHEKADKKRQKWAQYASLAHVSGAGDTIDMARAMAGKESIRQLMQQAAQFQAKADRLERYMRTSANCGGGRHMASRKSGKGGAAGRGKPGKSGVMVAHSGNKPSKSNKNNNNNKKKKKKKGGGMDGGGCAC